MDKATGFASLAEHRQKMYTFLSGLYLHEIDGNQLAAMEKMIFPQNTGVELLDEGYRALEEFLKTTADDCLDDLAVDYAKTFLSAGMAAGFAAFPYQSVYTDRQHMIAQKPASDLGVLYAAKGLCANSGTYKVPDDHIGLQLAFMAHLCKEAKQEQKDFLDAYLFKWAHGFCRDLEKYSGTAFYRAIAKITSGFLSLERQLMEMEGAGDGI